MNGSSEAYVLASAAAGGRLALVTKSKKRRQSLHVYMLQVCHETSPCIIPVHTLLRSCYRWRPCKHRHTMHLCMPESGLLPHLLASGDKRTSSLPLREHQAYHRIAESWT